MRKLPRSPRLLTAAALILLIAVLTLGCGREVVRRKITAPRSPAEVLIDGRLTEWAGADTLRLDDTSAVDDPNRVKISTMWDDQYLYLAFQVVDHHLVSLQLERDHQELYKDDMIEVLFDPRMDFTDQWLEDDIVYHVNMMGQVKDDRGTADGDPAASDASWQSAAHFATQSLGIPNEEAAPDSGFNVELAVPWQELGVTPVPGLTIGINLAAGDAEGPEEHLWDWSGARPFRQPAAYGLLELR